MLIPVLYWREREYYVVVCAFHGVEVADQGRSLFEALDNLREGVRLVAEEMGVDEEIIFLPMKRF